MPIIQQLKEETERAAKQDLNLFFEGWSNNGIAATCANSFKIFKEHYKFWITLHSQITNQKAIIPLKEFIKKEEAAKIVLPSLVNKIV